MNSRPPTTPPASLPKLFLFGPTYTGKTTMFLQCEGPGGSNDGWKDLYPTSNIISDILLQLRYVVSSLSDRFDNLSSDYMRDVAMKLSRLDHYMMSAVNPTSLEAHPDVLEFSVEFSVPEGVHHDDDGDDEDNDGDGDGDNPSHSNTTYQIKFTDLITLSQEPIIVELLPFKIGLLDATLSCPGEYEKCYHPINQNFEYLWPHFASKLFLRSQSSSSDESIGEPNTLPCFITSPGNPAMRRRGRSPPSTPFDHLITHQDILQMYVPSTLSYRHFYGKYGDKSIALMDVVDAGGISESKEEMVASAFFENFDTILYFIPLLDYNLVGEALPGLRNCDLHSNNVYDDSIKLFKELILSKDIAGKRLVLCLNKIDLFKEQIKQFSFKESQPKYYGDDNDPDQIIEWVVEQYMCLFDNPNVQLERNRCQVKLIDVMNQEQMMDLYQEIYEQIVIDRKVQE